MDIERMKKLLNRKIEVGKKVNEVREVIKNYNKEKRDMYDDTVELFKPSIKAQKDIKKAIDDKQDELINQLAINDEIATMKQNQVIAKLQQNNNRQDEIITNIQENQKALTKGLSDLLEPYQREIIFRDELPKMIEDKGSDKDPIQIEDLIQLGDDEDLIQLRDDEVKPSTSKTKPKIMDPDEGMTDERKKLLSKEKFTLPLPSQIINENIDPTELITKVKRKIQNSEKYIKEKSTQKGTPKVMLSKQQKKTYDQHKKELPYYKVIRMY